MIYDCFTFFNELDLLEMRLRMTHEHVDRYVIVEANTTFSGASRSFCLEQHMDRFAPWADKIDYVQVRDMPEGENHWDREFHQRDAIMRGLTEAQPDDIILISDLDEIPDVPAITAQLPDDRPCRLSQKLYWFFLNYRAAKNWKWAVATRFAHLGDRPAYLRDNRVDTILEGCGWHFSYIMDETAIQTKINAFSHQEVNTAEINNVDHIALARAGKASLQSTDLSLKPRFFWERLDARVAPHVNAGLQQFVMPRPGLIERIRGELVRRHIIK
ncbi:hypothetical protein ACS3SW_06825 [Roseobacteraceae bacterium S113]